MGGYLCENFEIRLGLKKSEIELPSVGKAW